MSSYECILVLKVQIHVLKPSLLFLGLEAAEAPLDQVPLIESLPWALNYSRFIK